jgi:hypothetical protein
MAGEIALDAAAGRMHSVDPLTGGTMASSSAVPLWKRLVILLSGVVVAAVVQVALGQAGVSTVLAIIIALVPGFAAIWLAAKLLGVHLKWRV